jgi:hypothetical protein
VMALTGTAERTTGCHDHFLSFERLQCCRVRTVWFVGIWVQSRHYFFREQAVSAQMQSLSADQFADHRLPSWKVRNTVDLRIASPD